MDWHILALSCLRFRAYPKLPESYIYYAQLNVSHWILLINTFINMYTKSHVWSLNSRSLTNDQVEFAVYQTIVLNKTVLSVTSRWGCGFMSSDGGCIFAVESASLSATFTLIITSVSTCAPVRLDVSTDYLFVTCSLQFYFMICILIT